MEIVRSYFYELHQYVELNAVDGRFLRVEKKNMWNAQTNEKLAEKPLEITILAREFLFPICIRSNRRAQQAA